MEKDSGSVIQGHILGRGNATSPYTIQQGDRVVEFTESGDVTCTLVTGGTPTVTTVLAGARYAIGNCIATIAFDGTFSIG